MNGNSEATGLAMEIIDDVVLDLEGSPTRTDRSHTPEVSPHTSQPVTPDYRCKLCHKAHAVRHCKRFTQMPVLERLRTVVRYRYCARCLALSHTTAKCQSKKRCHKCGKDHHVLLHEDELRIRPRPAVRITTPSIRSRTAHMQSVVGQPKLIHPTIRCYALMGTRKTQVRILLDLCATDNLAHMSLGVALGHRLDTGQRFPLTLTSVHDLTVRLNVTATSMKELGKVTPQVSVPEAVVSRFNHIKLADSTFGQPSQPQLVLCAEVYAQIIRPGLIVQPGLPVAHETIFGYMLMGSFV